MTLDEYKKIKRMIVTNLVYNFEEEINRITKEAEEEIDKLEKKEDDLIDE